MKTIQSLCLWGLLLFNTHTNYAQEKSKPVKKIILAASLHTNYKSGFIDLRLHPAKPLTFRLPEIREERGEIKNDFVKWVLSASEPYRIYSQLLSKFHQKGFYLAEPGDSIHVHFYENSITFSGKGSNKFQLAKLIETMTDSLENTADYKMLSSINAPPNSLNDYLAWNAYLNKRMNLLLPVIERNKSSLSEFAYTALKSSILEKIEHTRIWKFTFLRRTKEPGLVNHYGLSNQDLCAIYDTTMNGPSAKWLRHERSYSLYVLNVWDMLHNEDYRKRGKFFKTSAADTPILGKDPEDPFISIYHLAKKETQNNIREELMACTLGSNIGVLEEVGFTSKVETILADYYTQPGYPEYKKLVKEYEIEQRAKWNRQHAQSFTLVDTRGNEVTDQQLKEKVLVFDFWFTGCTGCVQMAPALRKVEEKFKNDTNIVFVSVSIDKDKERWLNSIAQKKFTTGTGLQLYTGGQGKDHEIIKKYFIEHYPTIEVIDPQGRFLKYERKRMDPRLDEGKSLALFLQQQLAIMKDGPYVLYEGVNGIAYSVSGDVIFTKPISKATTALLNVQTDLNTPFSVLLKKSLEREPAEYTKPEKILVLSDIEGNFDAFRKLLQGNNIIDENFNWKFDRGHLVFAGDMFDRGKQVTECLWLIYSLEEKARASGGYVHFILGNHEIMNLQGNNRYTEQKYLKNAALLGKSLVQLYSKNSELGEWLRTKNIAEKIGDILFIHGGISRKMNNTSITISEINQLAQTYYDHDLTDYGDERINCIMDPTTSPFWYRAYYDDKKDMPAIIDSTLEKFNVNLIITGHTVVSDTISVHYNRKVINTDTKHAAGKSEALLFEDDKYFRVNSSGEKILLFMEPRRQFADQFHTDPKNDSKSTKK